MSEREVEEGERRLELTRPSSRRLDTIDALRAFAALGVVFTHIGHHAPVEGKLARLLLLPFDLGYLGVTCFLVISGFCIHLAASARPGGLLVRPSWPQFWRRRMYRLYPAYIAAAVLSYAVYACLPASRYSPINQVHWIGFDAAAHASMLHNLFEHFPFSLGNGVFWTLGMEEQLYGLYALYVVLRYRQSAVALVVLTLVVSLMWRLGVVVPFRGQTLGAGPLAIGSWWTWPFGWWFCWVLGAIAAEVYIGAFQLPRWCHDLRAAGVMAFVTVLVNSLTLGQLGYSRFVQHMSKDSTTWFVLFQLLPQLSEMVFAVCVFICTNRLVRTEQDGTLRALWSPFAMIGRRSYSLYLTHVPVLMVLEPVLPSASSLSNIFLRYAVLVPASLGFAWFFFWAVERHFLFKRKIDIRVAAT